MIFGIIRIALFFSPLSTTENSSIIYKQYSARYVGGFVIDWISSGIPTLVGLFTAFIILVLSYRICISCINGSKRREGRQDEITSKGILRKLFRNKALRRFLIIDCNCPCYKARPKLRFQVRFALLCIFFILRIVSISLYATAPSGDGNGETLAIVCAFSLIFIFNTICLDFYRYYVWWHYTPQYDTRCHLRSKKHERYLPYHMVGDSRDPRTLGDRPCTDKPCHKRTLDHVVVFHGNDYQPQTRWRDIPKPPPVDPETNSSKLSCLKCKEEDNQPHYIGFHTTDPQSAISIAHSEFRPGNCGWLGAGVYFARSIAGTIGKAKSQGGAHIVAEIRMGKVYEIEREVITKNHPRLDPKEYDYVHHSKWQADYDTCYMLQIPESTDEFAIKDPEKQIVKWVIVIEEGFDPKVEKYEFLTEFDSTECNCI
jgi:hypothetical protein